VITFTATGTPPVLCGTVASVSSLRVGTNTRIILDNQTGVPAIIDVGKQKVLDLQPGMGARIKLKPGQHEVSLVPDCAVITGTAVVAVSVDPGNTPPDASPSAGPTDPADTPGSPPRPSSDAPGTTGPAVGGSGSPGPKPGPGPGPKPGPKPGPGPGPGPDLAGTGATNGTDVTGHLDGEVIEVQAFSLGDSRDPKGVRLLAVIAAICVFGVTVAITRAIVSERTSTTVTI
jgi:hypothetical protein